MEFLARSLGSLAAVLPSDLLRQLGEKRSELNASSPRSQPWERGQLLKRGSGETRRRFRNGCEMPRRNAGEPTARGSRQGGRRASSFFVDEQASVDVPRGVVVVPSDDHRAFSFDSASPDGVWSAKDDSMCVVGIDGLERIPGNVPGVDERCLEDLIPFAEVHRQNVVLVIVFNPRI